MWAVAALTPAARAASCTASRVDSTIRTWRSAPWATSETAEAISPTARPASWEVAAMSREALPRLVAVRSTWPTSSRRLVVMAANERPSASRSDFGSTVTVRSPSAIRSAAAPISFR